MRIYVIELVALFSLHKPAMARAAALAGIEMNPNEAGTLFPIEWQ